MNVVLFKRRFPEFKDTDSDLIEAKAAMAAEFVSPSTFGTLFDSAWMYYTAHLLAASPEGERARLAKQPYDDIYLKEYKRMARVVSLGLARNT